MNSFINDALRPLLAVALAGIVANCNQGCKPLFGSQAEDVYRAKIVSCSSTGPTREAALECRKAVNREYNVCDPAGGVPC